MLDDNVKQSMDESVLCWLATVDKTVYPNVSPKEIFTHHKDKVIIANIASPSSIRNIQSNSKVCVSFIHVFKQCGYKLTGQAKELASDDPNFAESLAKLKVMAGEAFEIKSIIEVEVEQVAKLQAPSYFLEPKVAQATLIEAAMKTYGVKKR